MFDQTMRFLQHKEIGKEQKNLLKNVSLLICVPFLQQYKGPLSECNQGLETYFDFEQCGTILLLAS